MDDNIEDVPDYAAGSIVWAKLRGYPWWPARVEKEDSLPLGVAEQKRPNRTPVLFLGSFDYAWFAPDTFKDFDSNKDAFGKNPKTDTLKRAIQQAENPNMLEEELTKRAEKAARSGKRKVSQTPTKLSPQSESPGATPSSARSKKAVPSELITNGKETPTPKRSVKRGRQAIADSDDDLSEVPKTPITPRPGKASENRPKRQRATPAKIEPEKPTTMEVDSETTEEVAKSNSEKPVTSPSGKSASEKNARLEKRLLRIRAKLQAFWKETRNLAEGETLSDAVYQEASEKLDELSNFDLNVQLVMNTKVGKLIKYLSKLQIPNDTLQIMDRSKQLLETLTIRLAGYHPADVPTEEADGDKTTEIKASEQNTSSPKEEKVKEVTEKEEPMKEEPMKEKPMKEESMKEESVKEKSVKEEPVKEEPMKEEPMKEEANAAAEVMDIDENKEAASKPEVASKAADTSSKEGQHTSADEKANKESKKGEDSEGESSAKAASANKIAESEGKAKNGNKDEDLKSDKVDTSEKTAVETKSSPKAGDETSDKKVTTEKADQQQKASKSDKADKSHKSETSQKQAEKSEIAKGGKSDSLDKGEVATSESRVIGE